MTNRKNRFFDVSIVEAWDDDPMRRIRAKTIADEIMQFIPEESVPSLLDFGAGTGLLTINFVQFAGTIYAVDNSQVMLGQLRKKIDQFSLNSIETVCWNIFDGAVPVKNVDIIVSAMTMHHIKDVDNVINTLSRNLKNGGYFCIADLEEEDGDFHEDSTGIYHFGFQQAEIKGMLMRSGVKIVQSSIVYTISKKTSAQIEKEFPVFLIIGQKF